ncbi:MAG: 50S ribosomal protein L9 [Coriobacteriales bacterium]
MKVILLKELKGRGGEGDVVDVAQGYAVNYLLPQGIAIEATKGELKQLEQRRHNIEKRELARTTDANVLKNALDGKTIKVYARVGDEGQLFGSVTTAMLAEAILDQLGVTVERKKIDLGKAIKTAGKHEFTISVYRDIKATLEVNVVSDDASIDIQETEEIIDSEPELPVGEGEPAEAVDDAVTTEVAAEVDMAAVAEEVAAEAE